MAISRQKKEEVLAQLSGGIQEAGSVVFVTFHGLTVAESSAMRRALNKEGIRYLVAKKTLVRRALDSAKVEGERPELPGELALAWGEDLIAPAREIYSFAKDKKGQLGIVGGIFDGRYLSAAEMTDVATIPSRETLYAQFLNLINSPIQRFAIALNEVAKQKEGQS